MGENDRQPTYKRQRFLLSFVKQISGTVTSTDLQKLIFLSKANEVSEYYEFIPYKYGSYSFQLTEDLDILKRAGYIVSKDSRIHATGNFINNNQYSITGERGDMLIKKVYREQPYYAINSEILGRLFDSAEISKIKQMKKSFRKENQVLFTIGYEGKSIEAFVNLLIKNDVRLLCDVRKNPLSRKFGFSKNKLKHIIETVGLSYVHIPDLGIESNKRTCLETKEDYQRLFKGYKNELANHHVQLESLFSLLQTKKRIALMCYEKDPDMCHRHVIRDYLINTHAAESVDL
jgi:uncharacterized protein (DUF488 family)